MKIMRRKSLCFFAKYLPLHSVKTGGLSEQVLGDKLTVVEFPDMSHGWTVGGDLDDPNVARDVAKAKELVLEFLEKYLE